MRVNLGSKIISITDYFAQPTQLIFLSLFFAINLLLFVNAVPVLHDNNDPGPIHATYAGAADGQRYWGVAKELTERQAFEYERRPGDYKSLQRGGPLAPLLFALIMSVAGFNNAPILIVTTQCLMLFGVGLMARRLAEPFQANKTLVQALIIFNPNLIGLAHHAQSEMLFTFIFALLLLAVHFLIGSKQPRFSSFIFIGLLAGLLPLARPAGITLTILLPAILLLSLSIQTATGKYAYDWKSVYLYLVLGILVGLLITTPWLIRNKFVTGHMSFNQGSHRVAEFNFFRLLHSYGYKTNKAIKEEITSSTIAIIKRDNINPCCIESKYLPHYIQPSLQCNLSIKTTTECLEHENVTLLLFKAIFSRPLSEIAIGLSKAWLNIYVGGGATAIANYLGFSSPDMGDAYDATKEIKDPVKHLMSNITKHGGYLAIFILATCFSVLGRLLGIIGFLRSIAKKNIIPYNVYYISTILIVTFTYLFIGVSRFRAPLEPILAIYTAVGIDYIYTSTTSLWVNYKTKNSTQTL